MRELSLCQAGNVMQCVFNLWLNMVAGSPGTSSVSELPFQTLLSLACLKKAVSFATFCSEWMDQEPEQAQPAGSRLCLREGWWLDCYPPPPPPPSNPSISDAKKERGLGKSLCFPLFFTAVREKAWEQSPQGFRNIVSVCSMKSLATEWENEKEAFYQSLAQCEGGGDEVKEFTTSL